MKNIDILNGLEDFYKHHFVQDEDIVNMNKGKETHYRLTNVPIPGTFTGSVMLREVCGWMKRAELREMSDGTLKVVDGDNYIEGAVLNSKTGVLRITWKTNQPQFATKIRCDYEYICE